MNKVLCLLLVSLLLTSTLAEKTIEDLAGSSDDIVKDDGIIVDGYTEAEREQMSKSSEKHEFQADVSRVLDILINSLYTKKEIFLREAISNAADALDKIRFMSIKKPEVLDTEKNLEIKIQTDPEAKTVTITDTGVGMTKSDLINNLGTIARTDTIHFLEEIGKGGNLNLIGQFGVGFYSYFLVANKVMVQSKHNDDDQYVWESEAGSSFSLAKDPKGNTIGRGTRITLFLKQDAHEYTDIERIKGLIKQYSEFISFPISVYVKKEVSREVEVTEDEEFKDESKSNEKKDDLEIQDDKKDETQKKTKTVKDTVWEWERINNSKAIWLRDPEEIEEDEYKKFYKSITKDYDDPTTWMHFKGEGEVEFTSVLFIPKRAPRDMLNEDTKQVLKLYVRRVLISDSFEELLPRYLKFVRGIVDSDDIPLNVSRENLQQMKMLRVMQRKLVKKVLDMIKKMATAAESVDKEEQPDEEMTESEKEEFNKKKEDRKKELREKYEKFFGEYGKMLKLGVIEDSGNRGKLAKFLRFYSTNNKDQLTSLDDYIERSKKLQDSIYYFAGEERDLMMQSPLIQGLLKRGYEVLLLDDNIDEYCLSHLNEYEKKKLVNVAKSGFKFPGDDDEKEKLKKLKKMYQPLTSWLADKYKDFIERAEVSLRLVTDPMLIAASEHGYSGSMEKIARAQAHAKKDRANQYYSMKKVLEINPYHPFIRELLERVKTNVDADTEESAKLMLDVALLNSGTLKLNLRLPS
jgi:heat shock protein beta